MDLPEFFFLFRLSVLAVNPPTALHESRGFNKHSSFIQELLEPTCDFPLHCSSKSSFPVTYRTKLLDQVLD